MSEGLDLKAFLEEQAAEGTADSVGAFTVAKEKALQKLANFALPEEFDWVLKVVQAANLWRVPELVVRQTRVTTSFYMCPPRGESFPTENAIVQALDNPVLEHGNPIHAVAMALRSLVQQSRLSFVLAVRHEGEMYKPIFAGDDISGLDPKTREEWSYLSTDGIRLTVSHFQGSESLTGRYLPTFTQQQRRDVEILTKLEERCFASSVPVEVDGRNVGLVFPRGDYFVTHRQRPLAMGQLPRQNDDPGQGTSLQFLTGQVQSELLQISTSFSEPDRPWFLVTGSDPRVYSSAYHTLSGAVTPIEGRKKKRPEFTVWWTRQGVTVAHHRFEGFGDPETSLQLFLPADHLRTDLSGLEIERDRSQWGRVNCQAPLRAIAQELERLLPLPESREQLLGRIAQLEDGGDQEEAEPSEGPITGSGVSVFSGDLLPPIPTPGLGLLRALGRASRLLTYLPTHDSRMQRWADRALAQLGSVRDDLTAHTHSVG